MSLRIRRLEIRIATAVGTFGLDVPFEDGLNVIAAPNTSGKSTAVMSILYALGLEGMLGSSQQPPLPDSMSSRIMYEDREINVVESKIRLEIENKDKQRITIERFVTGDNSHRQLIRGVLGPALTAPDGDYPRKDFYVRTAGAAQDESGFHRYLAEFIGYKLPRVPGSENDSVPLYLECLFPYFFVDQLTGWRDIKARMPTYLRIPEMAKRGAEFILDLDILHHAIEKLELQQKENILKDQWRKSIEAVRQMLAKSQVIARGIPEEPISLMPASGTIQLFATDGVDWIPLSKHLKALNERKSTLIKEEIPKAEEVSQAVIAQLRESEEELSRFSDKLETSTRDIMAERAHRDSVLKRLKALTEDYTKYVDAKRIRDRGGLVTLASASGKCPTCHQSIKDSLLTQDKPSSPMTLEDNLAFIKDQLTTFRDMLEDIDEVLEAKEQQIEAIMIRIRDINASIRAQRKTLHTDGRAPSIAAVQEQLQVEATLLKLEIAADDAKSLLQSFKDLSAEFARIQSRQKELANVGLSQNDQAKLELFGELFLKQLEVFKFESFPLDTMSISQESYRPSRLGYDVGLTSASDTIRIIWAYLLSMLEVARTKSTQHLGLLVFDEPRQHGAKALSFDLLLKRSSTTLNYSQQVIVATSEDRVLLDQILAGVKCNFLPFDRKMLTLIPPEPPEPPVKAPKPEVAPSAEQPPPNPPPGQDPPPAPAGGV